MKLTLIGYALLSLLIMSQQSLAQDTTETGKNKEGNFLTVETQYLLRNDPNYIPNIKFRNFFNEALALRTSISYQYNSNAKEIIESGGDGIGTLEYVNELFQLSVGFEKHYNKEKISPYWGAELILGKGRSDVYGSRTDSLSFIADFNFSTKTPIAQLGVQLFSGVDVYIYEGLYIGTEIGVKFLNTNQKRGVYKGVDGSSSTAATVEESLPAVNSKGFSVSEIGLIRLGWSF